MVFGVGSSSGADSSDSNQNEPEPEPHKLVAPKEPKPDSKADSKAGITAALITTPFPKRVLDVCRNLGDKLH